MESWELDFDAPVTATSSASGDAAAVLERETLQIAMFRATESLRKRIEKLERGNRPEQAP